LSVILAVYLFAGFYHSVARPGGGQTSWEVLRAVTGGDLKPPRSASTTRDELSFVATGAQRNDKPPHKARDRTPRPSGDAGHAPPACPTEPRCSIGLETRHQVPRLRAHLQLCWAYCSSTLTGSKLVNDLARATTRETPCCGPWPRRLSVAMRHSDHRLRGLAGDEFVVISEDIRDTAGPPSTVAERDRCGRSASPSRPS